MTKEKVLKKVDLFMLIGLHGFFNVDDDKNVNWGEFFELSDEEKFYSANNNQIIEDDKKEDELWSKYLTPKE